MTDLTERLDAIQARAANCLTYNFGMRDADTLAHSDIPFLLDLARKQGAALEAAWSEGAHFGGLYPVVFQNDNPYRTEVKP